MKDLEKEVDEGSKLKKVDRRTYLEKIDSRGKSTNQCCGYPPRRPFAARRISYSYRRSN